MNAESKQEEVIVLGCFIMSFKKPTRKSGFTLQELVVTIFMIIVLVFFVRGCTGCRSKNPPIAIKNEALNSSTLSRDAGDYTEDHSVPIADAKNRLDIFIQKREKIEPLLKKSQEDRDELITKLREIGVNSTADLKGNARGQRLAESVQKLETEIAGLQGQITLLDTAIVDARAFIRRVEREAAGISEEEIRKLDEQLRDIEDRTDGTPLPVTPLDIDAALEKAFKVQPSKQKALPSAHQPLAAQLIGKWQVSEGRRKGTIEFTKGGTALLAWSDGLRNALGESERRATLRYSVAGNTLKIEASGDYEYRQKQEMQVEVVSGDEIIFVIQKSAMSFGWLEGRFSRFGVENTISR